LRMAPTSSPRSYVTPRPPRGSGLAVRSRITGVRALREALPHKSFEPSAGLCCISTPVCADWATRAPCIRPTSLTRKGGRYGLSLRAASL
jgi:hypothetical protein